MNDDAGHQCHTAISHQEAEAMDAIRAQKISNAFSRINIFSVESTARGVCVHYLDNHAYFVREACFWPFAFNLGRVSHEERQIAEIEAELTT